MRILSEPPVIAFLKTYLGSIVCVISLIVCMLIFRVRLDGHHIVLLFLSLFFGMMISQTFLPYRGLHERIGVFLLKILAGSLLFITSIYLLILKTDLLQYYSEQMLWIWLGSLPFMLLLAHFITQFWVWQYFGGIKLRKTIVVGATELASLLNDEIQNDPALLMNVAGFFEDRELNRAHIGCRDKIIGSVDRVADYVKDNDVNIVLVTLPIKSEDRILRLLDSLKDTTASVYFVPDIFVFDLIQSRIDHIHNIPVVSVLETPITHLNAVYKGCFDFVLALLLVLLLIPIMILIALAIKLTSRGPVVFRQYRYGLDGKRFKVYKFRSMTVCEEGADVRQATQGDRRVTKVGGFLRRTSLDELPQFFNVLNGDMSIVGPRPHAVAHNEEYRKLIHGYMLRHKVKPGITGWAQVHGLRGETDTLEKMQERVKFDLEYLRTWSPMLDLWIIVKTAGIVLKGDNAY